MEIYPEKLKATYQYPGMTPVELEQIVHQHEQIFYKKGDYLLQAEEVSHCYYILQSGMVRSFIYDFNGNDITTDFFCEDDVVIEVASIFHQIPTSENWQCLTDCTLWKINYDAFQELFLCIPTLTEWGRAWMAYQLFLTKKRNLDMISLSALDRYKQLLEQKPQIIKQAPLKHIASFLGITDTSLSRIRKEAFR